MAPPQSRRSSQSRRVQYSVFTGYVLATIGAVVGAILLGLSLLNPSTFAGPRTVAGDAIAPIGQTTTVVRTEGQSLIESITGYLRAGSQNARLKREVELARIRLAEARAVEQENTRLKGLLDLPDSGTEPVAVTRLIGSSAASARRFGYLGAGRSQGIEVGMPVRSDRGVLGRVLEAGQSASRILLLSDSQSVVPVRLSDTQRNLVAFAVGRGDGKVQIRLVNLGLNPLKRGDVMVTSGAGGYYSPGIAVAIVTETNNDGALARMISDPAATNYVAVMPIWEAPAVESAAQPNDAPLEGVTAHETGQGN